MNPFTLKLSTLIPLYLFSSANIEMQSSVTILIGLAAVIAVNGFGYFIQQRRNTMRILKSGLDTDR